TVGRDLQRGVEPGAANIAETPAEVIARRERHSMHEDIERPEAPFSFGEYSLDLLVRGDVALLHEVDPRVLGQGEHALFQHFSRVAEADRRALAQKRLGDPPRNRAFIRDAIDERILAFEYAHKSVSLCGCMV